MNAMIAILCLSTFCAAASAGPYYPYYKPYAGIKSYYYGGAAPVVPAAALAAAPALATAPAIAPAPALLSDYYTYAAATALGYPGYGYGYPYFGAYTGYPYLKK